MNLVTFHESIVNLLSCGVDKRRISIKIGKLKTQILRNLKQRKNNSASREKWCQLLMKI